ncbi:MAG: TadE family protein [Desulfovibrio sp.]
MTTIHTDKRNESKRGLAAAEFALVLPMIALMMFLLLEGGNAMRTYFTLAEASREGARLVLMDGDSARVSQLVDSLAHELREELVNTSVNMDDGLKKVTVEVSYEYQPFYGAAEALEMLSGEKKWTFSARTTMPLP